MSAEEILGAGRKTYDDISFQKRKKLIFLINQQKWTIKAAAQEIGIKLCTAKQILYLYRKQGKIYKKRQQTLPASSGSDSQDQSQTQPQIVYVPYPYFIFCCVPQNQLPISLGDQRASD